MCCAAHEPEFSTDDFPLVCRAHCTSKVRSAADVACAATLGFRGEALHALASLVRRLSIRTRSSAQSSDAGRIGSDGGDGDRGDDFDNGADLNNRDNGEAVHVLHFDRHGELTETVRRDGDALLPHTGTVVEVIFAILRNCNHLISHAGNEYLPSDCCV